MATKTVGHRFQAHLLMGVGRRLGGGKCWYQRGPILGRRFKLVTNRVQIGHSTRIRHPFLHAPRVTAVLRFATVARVVARRGQRLIVLR